MAERTPVLATRGISKWFGPVRALTNIDFEVYPGEVVALIASGHSDKEIATALGIATATAQKHVTNVLRRLKVPNRAAAAVAAAQIALAVTTWPAGD